MKNSERILVNAIAGREVPGETAALCGSIQNYRKKKKKHGRIISFRQAAKEWEREIFLPIITDLKKDHKTGKASGKEFTNEFFRNLYKAEGNDFKVDVVESHPQTKERGFMALLHKLIA